MAERVWLWMNGQQRGPFRLDSVHRMAQSGQINRETKFFDETRGDWFELSDIFASEHRKRMEDFRQASTKRVEFLDSGLDDACDVCRAYAGRVFTITDAPMIPPPGCKCEPWCRAVYIARG